MADVTGAYRARLGEREYTFWVGWSVLAELQERHGQDALQKLDPPEGAGANWLPPMAILLDLMVGALRRNHAGEVESLTEARYLVDDLIAANPGLPFNVLRAAFPDQEAKAGNAKGPKRAA
jgi:hypothetical protein